MPYKWTYKGSLSDIEILEALHANYVVDKEKGEIYSKKTGAPLFRFYARIINSEKRSTYPRVCIKYKGRQGSRAVNKLIWMYSRNTVVPAGCHIHHLDLDHTNDNWRNLICIWGTDHNLIHLILNGHLDTDSEF